MIFIWVFKTFSRNQLAIIPHEDASWSLHRETELGPNERCLLRRGFQRKNKERHTERYHTKPSAHDSQQTRSGKVEAVHWSSWLSFSPWLNLWVPFPTTGTVTSYDKQQCPVENALTPICLGDKMCLRLDCFAGLSSLSPSFMGQLSPPPKRSFERRLT